MIKRSTWVWMVIFVALAAVAIYLQRMEDAVPSATSVEGTSSPVPTMSYLFPAEEGVVTSMLIEGRDGKIIGFERQGEVWAATTPIYAETIPGSVEAAASQVTALPIEKTLDLDPSDVGLDSPAYTITIGFTSGKFIVVLVGDETPTGAGYYVRKDDGPVLVVNTYSLASLLDMLTQPPLVETPTPTPAPPTETPTITPTPAATETGTPTATKAP
jgi:hypothetical protein